ncbi:MAG: phospho-N-acetylmuramoyl-pentapeptide-transferase [Candidatus Cloacimonadota bacterium]|nr:MAG: phospho-N-acetylmuramoyl-pentapeptide-transferase [Candidatus Cloacimonadota bacterium]
MFYFFLEPFIERLSALNLFNYITFRSAGAFLTSLMITFFIGPCFISLLQKNNAVEKVNIHAPENHAGKNNTPTMGGIFIVLSIFLSSVLWNRLDNYYILYLYFLMFGFAVIGFLDDYLKNFCGRKEGLSVKAKTVSQLIITFLIVIVIYFNKDDGGITKLSIPFFKSLTVNIAWFFILFASFFIFSFSTAVNFTDGLDGLAAGTVMIAAFALGIIAYIKGNSFLADYLNMEHLKKSGELLVFLSSMIGTLAGFLWFNAYPAQVFMGDTGSLTLGGLLALAAVLLREEFCFIIIGGIFVAEGCSSFIQKYWFKYTRIKSGAGKRFFKKAPLHHHFEETGIPESKIVARFWIVAMFLAVLALSSVKVR